MKYHKNGKRNLWQLKKWHYKRCKKCLRNHKYEDVLDLYLVKDSEATWVCKYCQYSETILIDELLVSC